MRKNIFNDFLDDQGIFWGLAAFNLAEIVQSSIVEIVFRHTAKKIKARLGSGTSIKKFWFFLILYIFLVYTVHTR